MTRIRKYERFHVILDEAGVTGGSLGERIRRLAAERRRLIDDVDGLRSYAEQVRRERDKARAANLMAERRIEDLEHDAKRDAEERESVVDGWADLVADLAAEEAERLRRIHHSYVQKTHRALEQAFKDSTGEARPIDEHDQIRQLGERLRIVRRLAGALASRLQDATQEAMECDEGLRAILEALEGTG